MAHSVDRRKMRSRKAIFDAFEMLLAEKAYSDITAGEIIERANIGRTTFYSHFATKDALLGELCHDVFAHVLSAGIAEHDHYFSKDAPLKDMLVHTFYHFREESKRLAPLLNGPSCQLFWSAFEAELAHFMEKQIDAPEFSRLQIPSDLKIRYLATSFSETAQWWFEHDIIETPEDMGAMFLSIVG